MSLPECASRYPQYDSSTNAEEKYQTCTQVYSKYALGPPSKHITSNQRHIHVDGT